MLGIGPAIDPGVMPLVGTFPCFPSRNLQYSWGKSQQDTPSVLQFVGKLLKIAKGSYSAKVTA